MIRLKLVPRLLSCFIAQQVLNPNAVVVVVLVLVVVVVPWKSFIRSEEEDTVGVAVKEHDEDAVKATGCGDTGTGGRCGDINGLLLSLLS